MPCVGLITNHQLTIAAVRSSHPAGIRNPILPSIALASLPPQCVHSPSAFAPLLPALLHTRLSHSNATQRARFYLFIHDHPLCFFPFLFFGARRHCTVHCHLPTATRDSASQNERTNERTRNARGTHTHKHISPSLLPPLPDECLLYRRPRIRMVTTTAAGGGSGR